MTLAFDLDDTVTLRVEVRDASGALTNAATVDVTVTFPDASTVTPTPTNPSVGVYEVIHLATQPGRHLARWVTTDPHTSYVDTFDVRPAAPAYIISLADAKKQLNFTDTDDDEELRSFIEAATGVIERHRNEVIPRRSVTEHRDLAGRDEVALRSAPVISLTSVQSLDGSVTWNVADLKVVDPQIGKIQVVSGPSLDGDVTFTYVAGYELIPAHYTLAARMIVDHLWETQRGQSGATRFMTTEDVTTVPGFNFAVPRKALELLGDQVPTLA